MRDRALLPLGQLGFGNAIWVGWTEMDPLDLFVKGGLGLGLIGVFVRAAALVIVPNNRRPNSALAWLMVIFFLPFVGVVLYLLIGNTKLPARRRQIQREINQLISAETDHIELVPHEDPGPPWLASVVRLNRLHGALPLVTGNHARLIEDYDESFAQMISAIDGAKEHVHCEFYIASLDETTEPFFDALDRAQARGAEVKLLFDHIGSRGVPGYRRLIKRLKQSDIRWQLMLPIKPWRGLYQRPDLRNHRKLLVIDNDVAFMGSQNLVDRSYNKGRNIRRGLKWQELMVRLDGPIVSELNALFWTDWFSETGERPAVDLSPLTQANPLDTLECQIVPSGPGFDSENNLKLFNAMIYAASERVSITSPYFVPDESLMHAVTTAAERGVEVELFVSEIGDQPLVFHAQRSYYETLLRAGVRIYLYPAPYILHAKHMSIDSEVAVIGSSNMDMRSFDLNLECTLLVSGTSFVNEIRSVEDHYRNISRELTLEEHLARPGLSKVVDNLARLTSSLQ